MHITLSLVGLTFLAVQCRSQAIRENDRQYPAIPTQYQQIDQENLRQERQLQQLSRRQDRRISQDYRYQYEPEPSYSAETQYQPSYSETSNRIITRPRQLKPQQQQLPTVEQYHKEVTPTTKTTYDPSTYQPVGNAQAQSAIEYFLHPEQQKQPYIQHPRYELPESAKETEIPQNVVAYQNALIAHQNAIYEQQRADQLQKQQQDSSSKASLYASQHIQKKPIVRKLVKPKTSTLDEEIDYLTSLQYQQQQIQQQQLQQQNKVYEAKQPASVKYQARIPQYSKPELLAAEEEQGQVYQPQIQYSAPTRFAKPSKSPKIQSVYQPEYQQEIRYQPIDEAEGTKFQQFDPAQYEQYIQYQSQPQVQPQHQPQHHTQQQHQPQPQPQSHSIYNAGPKYLPEQKLVRYQEPVPEKYQPQSVRPSEEAVQKYRASIAKYYSTDGSKSSRPRQQIKPQYVQEEQPQQRYQAQQYEQPAQHQPQPQPQPQPQHQPQPQQQSQEIYQGPTDEEYKQSEFKQSLGLNSSLRILKSGKPVVFIGHEE